MDLLLPRFDFRFAQPAQPIGKGGLRDIHAAMIAVANAARGTGIDFQNMLPALRIAFALHADNAVAADGGNDGFD